MTRAWLRQQIVEKVLLTLATGIVLGAFLFLLEHRAERERNIQRSSDVMIDVAVRQLADFRTTVGQSDALLQGASVGLWDNRELELKERLTDNVTDLEMFAGSVARKAKKKLDDLQCTELFRRHLTFTKIESLNLNYDQAVESLRMCSNNAEAQSIANLAADLKNAQASSGSNVSGWLWSLLMLVVVATTVSLAVIYLKLPEAD